MGVMDALYRMFGADPNPVQPRTDFPGQDDLELARKYDSTYGTDMGAYANPGNGQRVRTMGLTAANEIVNGAPDAGGRPVMDQSQSDQLLKAWIAAQRDPVAALGFDPRKMALTPQGTPPANLAGFYTPKQDVIWSESDSPSTPVHEAMHRGLEQLRTALGGIAPRPTEKPAGMLEEPTIDLANRPVVKEPDGKIATLKTGTWGFNDGPRYDPKTEKFITAPTIDPRGKPMDDETAYKRAMGKGEHTGIFRTQKEADQWARDLSAQQGRFYTEGGGNPENPARRGKLAPYSEEEIVRARMAKHFGTTELDEQNRFASETNADTKTYTAGQKQAREGQRASTDRMFLERSAALDALAQREIARRRPMGPR